MPVTNVLGLPQPFVEAATRDHAYTPKRYSVTQILKGTRQAILERRHASEIEIDASDSVWAIFGSAVHEILRRAKETPDQLKENWVSAEMGNGYVLSGIFDLYDDSTGIVTDYKTCSVWRVIYDDWGEYRTQLLAYCWILRKMGFDASAGQIVALLKDHSKTKAKHDQDYPQHPVVTKTFYFSNYEFDGFESWANEKFREIERSEKLPDDELPLCTDDERWYTGDAYAVMKSGRKRAVKLYDNRAEADIHAMEIGGYVEHRPGSDRRCEDYCSCAKFCSHWRKAHEADR